jgi:hypothetical protein
MNKYLSKFLLLGPATVRELEGSITRYPIRTFGIVVGHKFTSGAIITAETSIYNIILTDDINICVDIIQIAGRLNRFRFSCKYFFIFFLISSILMIYIIK